MNLVFKNEECRREFCSTTLNRSIVEDFYDYEIGFNVVEDIPSIFRSRVCGMVLLVGNELMLFKEYESEEVDASNLLLIESLKYLPTDTSDSQDLRNKIKKFLQS